MRLARAQTADGIVTGEYDNGVIHADGTTYSINPDGATLLPPADPSALYCIGRNYAATLDQMDYDVPDEPDFFIKPPTALLAPGEPLSYPGFTDELTYAGELAAVIDKQAHNITPKAVPEVVRGYTILNDVDALDQPGRTARKAFDGAAPLGPWIETDIDPYGLSMHTEISGERRQEATTDQMLFDPYETVAFLSERFTFRPGDVIAFGSPENPGLIEPGDTVSITYEGIGTLEHDIVASE